MKLNLGSKIALSFGVILFITAGLGGYSIVEMNNASKSSWFLSTKTVPEVDLTSKLDSDLQALRMEQRGVRLSGEDRYLQGVTQKTGEVNATIAILKKFASENATDLPFLKKEMETLPSLMEAYSAANIEAEAITKLSKKGQEAMNQNGSASAKTLSDLINAQSNSLIFDTQTGANGAKIVAQTQVINSLQTIFNALEEARIASFKAQALRDNSFFEVSLKKFKEMESLFKEILALLDNDKDKADIATVKTQIASYEKVVEEAKKAAIEREKIGEKQSASAKKMDEALEKIMTNGINRVRTDSEKASQQLTDSITKIYGVIATAIAIGSIIAILFTRSLIAPIKQCVEAMKQLAAGDLTIRVSLKRDDELGVLAESINTSISSIRETVTSVSASTTELNAAAHSLNQTAASQAAGAEQTNVQANTVAAAGEELATNSQSMSEAARQITESTTTVAAAVEEMSTSIQEVARNCAKESEIAHQADSQARQTRQLMTTLDDSARQIEKVVELINRIANQTNLLALNATIEAASAGEAGRGFAVVANEVKELARQSAAATEDIRQQVNLIQHNTTASVKAIDAVAEVIEQVSSISSSIAAAVEEQSATTSEIVRSLHGVTSGTNTLSANVQSAASGATEVSRNIHGVSDAARESAKNAASLTVNASELTTVAQTLSSLVQKFKV